MTTAGASTKMQPAEGQRGTTATLGVVVNRGRTRPPTAPSRRPLLEATHHDDEVRVGVRASADSNRVLTTLLLTDIVASTERIMDMGDRRWLDLLDAHDAMVCSQIERFGGRHVKGNGDGVLAMFDGPARAIRCACAIREAAAELGIAIRAGVHTGEVEVRRQDVAGIAVHIVARVAALAEVAEVLVSRTVADLVTGSGLKFVDRGTHVLKGMTGEWHVHAVA